MAVTQAKVTSGGSFVAVTLTPTALASTADATVTAVVANGSKLQAMHAINQWNNCSGAGTHATAAQATANGAGVTLEYA